MYFTIYAIIFALAYCAFHAHKIYNTIIINSCIWVSFESIQSIFEAIFNLPCALARETIRDKSHERFTPKLHVNRWIDRISVTVLNRLHTPSQRHGGSWMFGRARSIPDRHLARAQSQDNSNPSSVDELNGKASRLRSLVGAGRENLIALRRAFESHSRKRSRNNDPFCLRAYQPRPDLQLGSRLKALTVHCLDEYVIMAHDCR